MVGALSHAGEESGHFRNRSDRGPRQARYPTLILNGGNDQIAPIGASAMLSSKLISIAILKVYKDVPRGMCATLKDHG
jgi:hypothetical protein